MATTEPEIAALKGGRGGSSIANVLTDLPVRVPRDEAAQLLCKYFFKTHKRSLERWPLAWRLLNGKAHCETAELFALAESMLAASPAVIGGRRSAVEHAA
jgi:hypothetical protein